jgi:hypothetical protein
MTCILKMFGLNVIRKSSYPYCGFSWFPSVPLDKCWRQATTAFLQKKGKVTVLWRHVGEWRYSSTFLNLSTRWRWVVSFTPLPLYPRGKSPRYPLDRRLGEPQSRSGPCEQEKNLALPGIEPGPELPNHFLFTTHQSFYHRRYVMREWSVFK